MEKIEKKTVLFVPIAYSKVDHSVNLTDSVLILFLLPMVSGYFGAQGDGCAIDWPWWVCQSNVSALLGVLPAAQIPASELGLSNER